MKTMSSGCARRARPIVDGAPALLGAMALALAQAATAAPQATHPGPWRYRQAPTALMLARSGTAAAAAGKPGPWHDMIRGNSAPLLRGWTHPGLPAGWHVHHGVLHKNGPVEDLESTGKYRDFELEFEWKIGYAGNSGIFYRATHADSPIYWTGPEYQLVDDAHTRDGKSRMTAEGSVYAVYPSPAGVAHPYGHWNSGRIVVRGKHVEYWMNGRRILSYSFGSADWKRRVAASKFAVHPYYGREPVGHVGIQGDHPGAVWLRDMRIRRLP
jgi:hypothetical protein